MSNVLVLGGSGFIGKALVARLVESGHKVTAVDRYWPTKIENAECIVGDVFEEKFLQEVLDSIDIVYHLVSSTVPGTSNRSPIYDCETNQVGTLHILQAMQEKNVKKIIFASSGGAVYGIPTNIPIDEAEPCFPISAYGVGKLAIERYLFLYSHLYGIQTSALRISNPYGVGQVPEKGQGVIATFAKRLLHNEEIEIWGDGSVVRDFIYIDDLVEALIKALFANDLYTLVNVGSGEGRSINDILLELSKHTGVEPKVKYFSSRNCDVPSIILNIEKAKKSLAWEPRVDFSQGIEKTLRYLEYSNNAINK